MQHILLRLKIRIPISKLTHLEPKPLCPDAGSTMNAEPPGRRTSPHKSPAPQPAGRLQPASSEGREGRDVSPPEGSLLVAGLTIQCLPRKDRGCWLRAQTPPQTVPGALCELHVEGRSCQAQTSAIKAWLPREGIKGLAFISEKVKWRFWYLLGPELLRAYRDKLPRLGINLFKADKEDGH